VSSTKKRHPCIACPGFACSALLFIGAGTISRAHKQKRPAIRRSQAVEESLAQQFLIIARFLVQVATSACGLYNRRTHKPAASWAIKEHTLDTLAHHILRAKRRMEISVTAAASILEFMPGADPGPLHAKHSFLYSQQKIPDFLSLFRPRHLSRRHDFKCLGTPNESRTEFRTSQWRFLDFVAAPAQREFSKSEGSVRHRGF